MDRWLGYLAGTRRQRDAATGLELRLLSAADLLWARKEALELAQDEESFGLWFSGCILAKALHRCGERVYAGGAGVLEELCAAEVERLSGLYSQLNQRENPSCAIELEELDTWVHDLGQKPYERLKWKVLRAFGALPTERRARDMTDGDYFYCAAQMALDAKQTTDRLCPVCRQRAGEDRCPVCGAPTLGGEENPAFDTGRFQELKKT